MARSNPHVIDTMVVIEAPRTEKNPFTAEHQATIRP
jgi:hypothetical protein